MTAGRRSEGAWRCTAQPALVLAALAALSCRDAGPPDDVPFADGSGPAGRFRYTGDSFADIPQAGVSGGFAGGDGTADGFGDGADGTAGVTGVAPGTGFGVGTGPGPGFGFGAGTPTGTGFAAGAGAVPGGTNFSAGGAAGAGAAGAAAAGATNRAPLAAIALQPICLDELQTDVTLISTSFDPDGDGLRCLWTMPAGIPNEAEGCIVSGVTFLTGNESLIELLVDDGRGGRSTATREIGPCSNLSAGQPADTPP